MSAKNDSSSDEEDINQLVIDMIAGLRSSTVITNPQPQDSTERYTCRQDSTSIDPLLLLAEAAAALERMQALESNEV